MPGELREHSRISFLVKEAIEWDMVEKLIYKCPMHPEVTDYKASRCPKCGMKLERIKNPVRQDQDKHEAGTRNEEANKSSEKVSNNYNPLIIVLGLIFIASLAIAYPSFNLRTIISSFMAGFFLVFAGFKLVDLKGFAEGYSTYDLLARKWFAYGYIYPFIELAFGLLMVLGLFEPQVLIAEIIIMTFSGIGVLIKILKHEKFQCVCLGTFLKVPLTYVTLIEDFGMVILALILLAGI